MDEPHVYIRRIDNQESVRKIACHDVTPMGADNLFWKWQVQIDASTHYLDMREVDEILHRVAREEMRDACEYRDA